MTHASANLSICPKSLAGAGFTGRLRVRSFFTPRGLLGRPWSGGLSWGGEVPFLHGFHSGLSLGSVRLEEEERACVNHVEMTQVEYIPGFAVKGHDI